MIDHLTLRRWLYQLLLAGLMLLTVFIRLLPLSPGHGGWPGADLMLAITFAWVLRRPEFVPATLVAVLFFLSGMLFRYAPGLNAALVVIAVEFLRSRAVYARDMPFAVEWGMVAVVMLAIVIAERLVLGIFAVEQVGFAREVMRLGLTVLVYPVAVAVSAYVLGVRRVLPGEAEALRHA